ncbi:hypothetical protein GCM10027033_07030 [Leucobacter ruminantium]
MRIDRLGAPLEAPGGGWDDVVLWLRGLAEPTPVSNAVNMLWIISHPEMVDDREIDRGWDHVYAASEKWAGERSRRTGTFVVPLLQAASQDRFAATGPADPHDILFVGTTRGVERPVVLDAVRVGAQLQIYGHGWEEYVEARYIRADHLSFEAVPAAYRGARRVLNDHWEDMKQEGFISNRLFEAVASGACVVSDRVQGMDELFGPMVRTYGSLQELIQLLDRDDLWPNTAERRDKAEEVLRDHSFDARARVLLRDALASFDLQ